MALSILGIVLGIVLFGLGGWWLYGAKGPGPVAGLAAQLAGMASGLAGLITLVLPDFFG